MIRNFVKARPSLTYLEVKLDDEGTPQFLEERTGIRDTCWRHCRPEEKDCYLTDGDDKEDR